MKLFKNTILNKINHGFSLVELIIAITISTIVLLTIFVASVTLRKGFIRVKKESVTIYDIAKFAHIIIKDGLNPDLFPHHPMMSFEESSEGSAEDGYILEENHIAFFANKGKVEYRLSDVTSDGLLITRGEEEFKYPYIKDFNIKYYDKKGFEIIEVNNIDFPDSCLMNFTFNDNKKRSIKMKL